MAMSPEEKRRKICERAQKWWLHNKERANENKRQWRERKRQGVQEKRKILSPEERRQKACERTREWTRLNKDRAKETKKQWKLEHPEEYKERKKQSHLRHRDEILKRRKEAYRINPGPILQRCKEWHQTHPEVRQTEKFKQRAREAAKKCEAKRRAAKVESGGSFTAEDIKRIYSLQDGKCAGCGVQFKTTGTHRYHVDHIIPLRPKDGGKPGSNGPENLQLLCRSCNCQKRNLSPEEWKRRRGHQYWNGLGFAATVFVCCWLMA